MADITYTRREVNACAEHWHLVEDACAGEHAIRAKREAYLPKPNAEDHSEANEARYRDYLRRAVYYNATGRTLQGLTGVAFRRWPEIALPAGLEYLHDDVDGSGTTLIQQTQGAVA